MEYTFKNFVLYIESFHERTDHRLREAGYNVAKKMDFMGKSHYPTNLSAHSAAHNIPLSEVLHQLRSELLDPVLIAKMGGKKGAAAWIKEKSKTGVVGGSLYDLSGKPMEEVKAYHLGKVVETLRKEFMFTTAVPK